MKDKLKAGLGAFGGMIMKAAKDKMDGTKEANLGKADNPKELDEKCFDDADACELEVEPEVVKEANLGKANNPQELDEKCFDDADAWMKLKNAGTVSFMSTSFIRGLTISNAIVVLDEMQNLTFHELDSIITRVGDNCRFIMCGDYYQSDFQKEGDKSGILKFLSIIEQLRSFETVEFGWEDIVRSDFVRDYIMTKEMLQIK